MASIFTYVLYYTQVYISYMCIIINSIRYNQICATCWQICGLVNMSIMRSDSYQWTLVTWIFLHHFKALCTCTVIINVIVHDTYWSLTFFRLKSMHKPLFLKTLFCGDLVSFDSVRNIYKTQSYYHVSLNFERWNPTRLPRMMETNYIFSVYIAYWCSSNQDKKSEGVSIQTM